MASNLVETVRDIPLNEKQIPEEDESSGFPFDDRDFDRGRSHSSFRSQLDDIARRHPEFAEHLNIGGGFPFRSHTLGRHRDRRGSDHDKPSGSQDAEFRRYPHDRPFSRFEHFDFPFRKYFDEDVPDFYQAEHRPTPERQPQYTYSTQQQPFEEPQHYQQEQQESQQRSQPDSPQPTVSGSVEKPPQPPSHREGSRKQNIQQSNTVDLGQKQEPVDENRGQRSMSAPPENRSTGQRFVSSINIPIQKPGGGGGNMGAKASTQGQDTKPQHQQSNKPNERVIPIHVEGRDEPIVPKNVNATFTQPPPQAHPHPQPPTERIFGRNPAHFTQFLNKGEPHGMTPEEHCRQQQQYQKQPEQNFQPQQQSQQYQSQPQEPSPAPPQDEPPAQPPPAPSKPNQLEQIQRIQKDVSELMNQVEKFNGKPRDKEYLYLDEMLTRNLIKLDTVETEGKDNIRQARKEAIKCIEGYIAILEARAKANLAAETQKSDQKMEIVQEAEKAQEETQTQQLTPTEKDAEVTSSSMTNDANKNEQSQEQTTVLEVSGVTRTGSVVNVTPMDVTTIEDSNKEAAVATQTEADVQNRPEQAPPSTETQQELEEAETAEIKIEGKEGENTQIENEQPKNEESMVVDSAKSEENIDATAETSSQQSEEKKEKKKGKKKAEKK